MKLMRFSYVALVAGLLLGVTALWAGATPIGVGGDLITGGWFGCQDGSGNYVAVTNGELWLPCTPCQGTQAPYCYEGGGDCDGGRITVAITRPGQPGATVHATGSTPCQTGWCWYVNSASCY